MKQVSVPAGRYVVAVSGGVDSMVLFDVLRKMSHIFLVVAHVNHGIRPDSHKDEQLVRHMAMSHNVPFESIQLQLGPNASEEHARTERYKFLRHIQAKHSADALLTAHHKDDLRETAIINMVRGTGWRGLSSLRSGGDTLRPLLDTSKAEIVSYARTHQLVWREDSTNTDTRYLRNRIRIRVLADSSPQIRESVDEIIVRQNQLADQIDQTVRTWILNNAQQTKNHASLPRYQLIMLPQNVAHEVFQALLRHISGKSLPRPLVARALLFGKVAKAGKVMLLGSDLRMRVTRREVIVEPRDNVVSLGNARGSFLLSQQLNED